MVDLVVNYNRLTGAIPVFPTTMQYVYLSKNMLTGGIPILPNGIHQLDSDGNPMGEFAKEFSKFTTLSLY